MSVRMIDVSGKEHVYREAWVEGLIRLKPELAKVIGDSWFIGLGNLASSASVAAIVAVKRAWEFIPLLHPIPITNVEVELTHGYDYIGLRVGAKTIAQTGVEMDALFGALTGLVAAWNVIKARHCTCGPNGDCRVIEEGEGGGLSFSGVGEIKGIEGVRVIRKIKGGLSGGNGTEGTGLAGVNNAPSLVALFDASNEPTYIGEAAASGFIKLKPSTVELIRSGGVEKGDVLTTAQLAAVSMAKRAWELLPLIHQNYLTHVSVGTEVKDNGVYVRVTTRNISRTGSAMEALMATGAALLTVWDMVKKHEKDENGQYPNTEISFIKLEKAIKAPMQ
ncbi:cyclic pyranopterin monophosphate synthase MoaC [Caldivirga sp. UBA161]|uniref:cyclic pyranopterin monophosphate synthase MoaC n=1 Tax=Caldivirga sp. UBA161 TaxID=1915569 RepID=UPI0025BB6B1E|nr:cyclic pyranopterin monophosphate synthase MoaC [Caldivirga sp. UBA161]